MKQFKTITNLGIAMLAMISMGFSQLRSTSADLQRAEATQRTEEVKKVKLEAELHVANAEFEKRKAELKARGIQIVNGVSYTGQVPQPPAAGPSRLTPLRTITDVKNYTNNQYESDEKEFEGKDLKSKEVSMEVTANKAADIYIENSHRTIEIKTWDQPKVKVTTTVYYEGDGSKLSDEMWFEKLNINFKMLGSSVRIKSGLVSGGNYSYGGGDYAWSSGSTSSKSIAIFNENGVNIGTKSNVKRLVTIYIPKENKLDVESKYADVSIPNLVNKLNADITNGNLELGDVNNLILRSKYSNVTANNLKYGEIDFINGRLIVKESDEIDLDTKYSTIEFGVVNKLNMKSTNDDYEIDELGSLVGRKNYGNFRATKLKGSFELDGTNADVKIRNLEATVSSIKVDNKYADLRFPMRNIKNYTVEFNGPYSTVYSTFEKKPIELKELKDPATGKKDELASTIRSINRSVQNASGGDDDCDCNDKFKATVGDGKGTKIEIKCQNCTVDFK